MLTKYALVAVIVLCLTVLGFTLLVGDSLCEFTVKEGKGCCKSYRIIFIRAQRLSGINKLRLPEYSNVILIKERARGFTP